MTNIYYDSYVVLSKVYRDGAYISQALTNSQIDYNNKRLTTKICYGVLDKDVELSYYLDYLSEKRPKLAIRTLVKIAMYCLKYLNKQAHTVTNLIVELAKQLGKTGASGYINAFLHNFISEEIPLPTAKIEFLSVKYSYPKFAVEKLIKTFGFELCEKIISNDEEHTFVRFNKGVDGEQYIKDRQFDFKTTPFQNLFDVKGFKVDEDFQKGIFTFQSIGSVAICEIAKTNGDFLDCCSAPGGKAVYVSDQAKFVTCFELHSHRCELIKDYARRMGKDNISVFCRDSAVLDSAFFEKFDTVLCDVPCSGFGTVKDNPDIKLNKDESCFEGLYKDQLNILSACSNYVKVGGYLVYSTCSIFEEENDGIIEKFVKNIENFVIEEINSPLDSIKTKFGLQFLPHVSFGAGFYVCKLKRIK